MMYVACNVGCLFRGKITYIQPCNKKNDHYYSIYILCCTTQVICNYYMMYAACNVRLHVCIVYSMYCMFILVSSMYMYCLVIFYATRQYPCGRKKDK
jgi:hypothetical protein